MIADAKVDAKYTGIVGSLRKIAVEEGVRGYFKGNAANILRIVPYSAVQFSTYGQFKKVSILIGARDDSKSLTSC